MNFSPELKRRIAALAAVLIVFFAALAFIFKQDTIEMLTPSDGEHYDIVKSYMQSQYTDAYAEYFDMAYVEKLSDYSESYDSETNRIEAEFVMNTYYKYPYRDPDTVPKLIEARENGNMEEYKKLYDEYNTLHPADYKLKIEAYLNGNSLEDTKIYGYTDGDEWVLLEKGLKDYIIEDE